MDTGDAYLGARERILGWINDGDTQRRVPATPEWDVGDVLRHIVGVASDVVTGNLDEYAQPQWTDAQIRARANASIDDVVAEWDDLAMPMTATLRDPARHGRDPMFARAPLVDLVVHEGDVARTLGHQSGSERDVALIDHLLTPRFALLHAACTAAEIPPLEISMVDGPTIVIGVGGSRARLETDRTTLWRSLHGRRTRAQVLGLGWQGDPEPYLDLWQPWIFTFPTTEIERA